MTKTHRNRPGFVKAAIVGALVIVGATVATMSWLGSGSDSGVSPHELTFRAVNQPFVSSIVESGDVASSSNVEIRCRVRERGGTAILKIIDEGTLVKKGDFLVQLDDSTFRDEVVERKIRVAEDRAAVIQAESNLDAASRALVEFENGQFDQELATYEAEYEFAQETLKRAREYRRYSENLARKGYVSRAQLEADTFAETRAEKELELAESKLTVFRKFSKQTMEAQLKATIAQEEANLLARKFTLKLSEQRLKFYEEQVEACRVTAPSDGQVVYANDIDGRGESGIVIEEGVTIREGQAIIRLPDPENMQVTTKVNDSKINSVKNGQECLIRLDTAPETPVLGRVRKVATFPLPRRWSQAPIEYEVFVDVVESNPIVRSGLRAKVEIFVEKIDTALQVPVSTLIERGKEYFVVVRNDNQHELRQVEIGPHNESTVVILSGIEENDEVMVDPRQYREAGEDATNAKDSQSDT